MFLKKAIENRIADEHPKQGFNCIGFRNDLFESYPCEDSNYFTDGNDLSKPALGYICEAKIISALNKKKSCNFPFKYQGKEYNSCAMVKLEGLNIKSPWCPLEIDTDGNAVVESIDTCIDEREIIIQGGGQGHNCPLPFIFDGIYYDKCTRKDPTLQSEYISTYWCPNPFGVGIGQEFVNNASSEVFENIGQCPDFLTPEYNGCEDNYEPLENNICVRLSAYPLTHFMAKEKCAEEGSILLQYINSNIEVKNHFECFRFEKEINNDLFFSTI